MLYHRHNDIIENAMIDGGIDIEKFMEKKDTYPEDFQKILTGLEKQNYYPVSIPDIVPFYPQYQTNELSKKIRSALHEDVRVYMTMLETGPIFNANSLNFSMDQSLEFLIDMEKTILASNQFDMQHGYWMLSHTYTSLFNVLVVNEESNEILDKAGQVKKEYRDIWEQIANFGDDSPAAFIMKKIVEEMKKSDWKESKSYKYLDSNHIYNALNYAQQNNLNLFTIDEFIGYGTMTTIVQDPGYQDEVKYLYENFSRGS